MVWKITHAVGSANGSTKTHKGGWKKVGQKPPEICVWNESYIHGSINFLEEIEQYMSTRDKLDVESDQFFLGVNKKGEKPRDLFKRQPIGRNTLGNIVKNV